MGASEFEARAPIEWDQAQASDQKRIPQRLGRVQQTAPDRLANVAISKYFLTKDCDIHKTRAMHEHLAHHTCINRVTSPGVLRTREHRTTSVRRLKLPPYER
jgi:hypothetical protein